MKVSGDGDPARADRRVWAALNDPAVLVRTIPGCERLEPTGPDAYRMIVTAGVASIKGTYAGEVALSDQQPPDSFVHAGVRRGRAGHGQHRGAGAARPTTATGDTG